MRWQQVDDAAFGEQSAVIDGEDDRAIPTSLWLPPQPVALLVFGHGGSGHRRDPFVHDVVGRAAALQWAVLTIEGPCHGDRRTTPPVSRPAQQAEFLEFWRQAGGIPEMTADWRYALRATSDHLPRDLPVVVFGLSMGTAYGIPLCAGEPRIRAAALGMWSADYPRGETLAAAAKQVNCPVLFQVRWDDEIFPRDGQLALFDSLDSPDKRLHAYPGKHVPPSEEMFAGTFDFLAKALGTEAPRT